MAVITGMINSELIKSTPMLEIETLIIKAAKMIIRLFKKYIFSPLVWAISSSKETNISF
ncbi:MAG: hypothetical protein OHK0017_04060 [Patescibacteria group bacterium]